MRRIYLHRKLKKKLAEEKIRSKRDGKVGGSHLRVPGSLLNRAQDTAARCQLRAAWRRSLPMHLAVRAGARLVVVVVVFLFFPLSLALHLHLPLLRFTSLSQMTNPPQMT